jgi:hypothetical protein
MITSTSGAIDWAVLIIVTVGIFLVGMAASNHLTMKRAFDRGYAVQCVGKTGYYWECE